MTVALVELLPSRSTCSARGAMYSPATSPTISRMRAVVVDGVGAVRGRVGEVAGPAREVVLLQAHDARQVEAAKGNWMSSLSVKKLLTTHLRRPIGSGFAARALRLVRLDHHRDDLVQVADDAVVGDAEDRRQRSLLMARILPDSLHAGAVLHGAADATGDVQRRAHGGAGLADLVFLADVAASTAARLAPTAPPIVPARSWISLKFSLLPTPPPPATIMRAPLRSTRFSFCSARSA